MIGKNKGLIKLTMKRNFHMQIDIFVDSDLRSIIQLQQYPP